VNGAQALAARMDMDQLTRRANILTRSISEAYDSLSSHQARFAALPSIMPTKGWLTSAFMRERVHPILHLARPHEGIDVSAPMNAEIEAPASGIVTKVEWVDGYGNMLTIDHGYGLVTRYAHCSDLGGSRPAREARPEDRQRRLDGVVDRTAPALRGVGERPSGRSDEVRAPRRDRGLTLFPP